MDRDYGNIYSEKDEIYFNLIRVELLSLIPETTKKLLDVGCGYGTLASEAKREFGVEEAIGIEKFEAAGKIASEKLDKVIIGDIESIKLNFKENYFDCIVCADILEHLVEPEKVLRKLYQILSKEGVMLVSIPNIRHIVPLLKIIFNKLEYESSGILDKTHLRFFTLHTMKKMFEETGFKIKKIDSNRSISLKYKIANLITLGLFKPFTVYQYIFVLKKM